jgi:glycyl-tRNA synthetase
MAQEQTYDGVATIDKLASLCRRRGFVFPSSDIYGGVGSTYDYGHYGVLLKNNVKQRWLDAMLRDRDDIVLLDSAIILHPRTWEASGHVAGFTDPLVDCRTCKKRYRADTLDQERCERKPSKRPGEGPECDLTEARAFNLMFETTVGPVQEAGTRVYLRPETAQGIFLNFRNYMNVMRRRPPFGIAQIGKSFRNEITPGNFLFRLREFEQMEMEYFVPPGEAERAFEEWVQARYDWYVGLGVTPDRLRIRPHGADELSHYSSGTSDIEYLFPIGWLELEGVANRGDFDLRQHMEHSGVDLRVFDPDTETHYLPHVIEPAAGVDRAVLAFLVDAYDEEEVAGRERTLLRLHPSLAPVTAAVLPLVNKDGMPEVARRLYTELRGRLPVEYDDSGSIGRRYRRQDEIGTPWTITIDGQTLDDETVTVRDRDTLTQDRVAVAGVGDLLDDRVRSSTGFSPAR